MSKLDLCEDIMTNFASETGLTDDHKPVTRYLWTDAFAVCNFLELYRQTTNEKYLQLALQLINQVHQVLGKYRGDDKRTGWISNLNEAEGAEHPTAGGLRIGKLLKERHPDEAFDQRLEWERDGQYFHYLTKWMHALNIAAFYSGNSVYTQWALELAQTVHRHFVYLNPDDKQMYMYWKMSTDLSFPLVPSMGQHDPLDALITYLQLQESSKACDDISYKLSLEHEIITMRSICQHQRWITTDSLGIGGLLTDAYFVLQLLVNNKEVCEWDLLSRLLEDAVFSLSAFVQSDELSHPALYRLAFRELGLSIGLHAMECIQETLDQSRELVPNRLNLNKHINLLSRYLLLTESIESEWLKPANQQATNWREHKNINEVMLVTSLMPHTYLTLNWATRCNQKL